MLSCRCSNANHNMIKEMNSQSSWYAYSPARTLVRSSFRFLKTVSQAEANLLVAFVFQQGADFPAQFHRILVPMGRDSVLHRCIENFFLGTGNLQRAVFLTGIVAAIDRFSSGHGSTFL